MIVSASHVRLAISTAGSREEAERLAAALVEGRLAACVNMIAGVSSLYRWHGKVERDEEVLLLIKTTAEQLEAVENTLLRLHSYEVPELLVVGPEAGGAAYLEWLAAAAGGKNGVI